MIKLQLHYYKETLMVALPFRATRTYNNIQNPPKALINIIGANHFSITNVTNPPGAIPDSQKATLANDVAIETIGRWSGLFLRASILNDKDAFNYIYFTGDVTDSNVIVQSQSQKVVKNTDNQIWNTILRHK
jgi:hypothetical protein